MTVAEVAVLWNYSQDTIRRRFKNEPGVIVISRRRRGTRIYESIRIPESVVERVYKRLMKGDENGSD